MSRLPQPAMVFWELTEVCNLSCRHCRRSDTAGHGLSPALAMDLTRRLGRWPGTRLVFSGGEPLIREDLFDLISEATHQGLMPILATNAILVTDGLAARLANAGIRQSSVSLLGSTPERHDRLSGMMGSFSKTVSGIRALQDAGISVQINAMVTEASLEDIEDRIRCAAQWKASGVHLFFFVPVGQGASLPESEIIGSRMLDIFPRVRAWIAETGLPIRLTCCPQYLVYQASHEVLETRMAGCGAGKSILFISSRGQVQPCGYFPLEVGDLLAEDPEAIWQSSPVLQRLADPKALEEGCGRCSHKALCGGCRARAYLATGNLAGQDPACPYSPR